MREKTAAMLLEEAISSIGSGTPTRVEELDEDLRARALVAGGLASLDLAQESRARESLRGRLAQELEQRRAQPVAPALRRPWVLRRPVLGTELGVLLVVVLLAVVAPRSLAALVEPSSG